MVVAFGGLASGCGNLLYSVSLAAPSNWVASWDANGDGRLDLVMSHATGVNVDFLARGEHGMFPKTATPSPLAGIKVGGFAVGAFWAGKTDQLAVLDTSVPTRLRILFYSRLGPGATPIAQVALGGTGAVGLAAGDVNGDGYDDLAVSVRDSNLGFGCITNGCILFVLGGASGPTLSPLSVSAGPVEGKRYDPAQPSIVDLNGDGKMDLVVPNLATREIVFIPGAGGGIFDQDNDVVLATTPQPPMRTGFADGTTQQVMLVVFLPGSGEHASGNYTRKGRTGPFENVAFFGSVGRAATTSFNAVVGLKMLGRADIAQSLGGGCAVIGDPKANSSDQVCPQSLLHQDFARNDVAEAPSQIDFGNVQVGETKTLTVTYRLALNSIWQRPSVAVTGPGEGPFQMVDLISESHLQPRLRNSSTIVARFAPTGPGPFQRVIKLQTQGDEAPGNSLPLGFTGGPISIVLRGVGVGGGVSAAGTKQVGFAEEASKYADDGGVAVYKEFATLGAKVNRWTLTWDPASPERDLAFLDRAVPAAQRAGVDLILSVFPAKASNTGDPAGFCSWLKGVAARYPYLHRFIVGNEVNATRFWSPQHTASDQDAGPRSYYATLTRCYDALKSVNTSIQVIGMGLAPRSVDANSTKPLAFIRALGAIYKKDTARGATPIMDAVAIHPYPNPNVNPPPAPDNAKYEDVDFYGIPQLDRVKQAVWDAFHGTAQKTTLDGLPIVIDEVGYQTDTTGRAGYTGTEGSPVVSETDQAAYNARVVGLYACDPSVSDVLLFHLIDEAQRNPDSNAGGWQSGLEYPDAGHKPSFGTVKDAIGLGCQGAAVTWKPSGAAAGGTTSSTAPPLDVTSSRALSSFALVQAADGSLTWEADASAPSALTVAWAVRLDRSSSKVGVNGTAALASGAPIALSIENDLEPGHYLGTVKLAGAGGTATFNLDFVVAGTFSKTPKRSPLVGLRAGDGSLRWTFAETVPEAATATPTVYRGDKPVRKGKGSTLRDGDPVVLALLDGLEPGTYYVRFLVRSAAKGSRGVDYVTPHFSVVSPENPSRIVWKRPAPGAAFWSSGTVAPQGGATLKVSWGSGSSVTKLQAGDPVSFYVDTAALKPGRYTLRVTISAPGGAGHDLGGQLTLRVA